MAHFTGINQELIIGETTIPGVREVNIPEDHPLPDVTHAGDADGVSILGGITYRFGCTMVIVDDDGGVAWDALVPGTEDTITYHPEGNSSGKPQFDGTIQIQKRDRPVQYNSAVIMTITFNISGAWTETDVAGT